MIYYLTLPFFPERCHFLCCHSCSIQSCYNGSYFRSLSNITRLPYSFYILSSLLNSLLGNNIMYKRTEHYLNQTCFLHRNTDIFLGKKAKLNVYAMSMPCTVKLIKRQRNQLSPVLAIRNLSFSFFFHAATK